jgi:hypothetical protein
VRVEIKTFNANVHVAAITVEDASLIFVCWIATGPSMKLTRWILCLWMDRTVEISCIKTDPQLSLIRMKCFIIHDGRFLGGIFGVTVPALKSAATITFVTLQSEGDYSCYFLFLMQCVMDTNCLCLFLLSYSGNVMDNIDDLDGISIATSLTDNDTKEDNMKIA